MVATVTRRLLLGRGQRDPLLLSGAATRASDSRRQLCRAVTNGCQFAIASSTGASARADRIVAASITPAVASWVMTR